MMKSSSLSLSHHFIILFLAMLACGILSLCLGKDVAWDVAAYHYYNPYAFFHHRWNIDYWPPAIMQVYFNPTMDFLTYFLINTFTPLKTEFILGAVHGINFWLIFYISYLLLHAKEKHHAVYFSLLLAIIGMYGPISFPEIGSFIGDNLISLFVLGAVLLQIRFLQNYSSTKNISYPLLLSSGLLLGIDAGLKLTVSLYIVGALAAFLCLPIPFSTRAKCIFLWSLAIISGLLLSSGYWMLFLWQHYHNPFFPLFNGFFHAAGFPDINWTDTRHFPKTFWQAIFFPFYLSPLTTDLQPFIDYRFPLVFVLFFIAAILYLYKWPNASKPVDISTKWLILFFVFSYFAWLINFSILRYFIVAQILCPLIIYLLLRYIFINPKFSSILLHCMVILILFTMTATKPERNTHYGSEYFNVKLPITLPTSNTLVLIAFPSIMMLPTNPYPLPQNYLLPFFPKNWRFVGIPFSKKIPLTLTDPIKTVISEHHGMIYLLANDETIPGLYQIAHVLGLAKSGNCQVITNDIEAKGALLCPVTKLKENHDGILAF